MSPGHQQQKFKPDCTLIILCVPICTPGRFCLQVAMSLSPCHTSLFAFLAATKQLYEWFSPSVGLCPCPSHLFHYVSHHRIIMKFSGIITIERSDVHAKGQCQRSKVNVTEVKTQFSSFRTTTPFLIHIWR